MQNLCRRRVHCSLPLRQLSELKLLTAHVLIYLFAHLASLPISNFEKLLRKTSANYFGKLRKTTSVKSYRRELVRPKSRVKNSSEQKPLESVPQFFATPLAFKQSWVGPITLNCSGIKENKIIEPVAVGFLEIHANR